MTRDEMIELLNDLADAIEWGRGDRDLDELIDRRTRAVRWLKDEKSCRVYSESLDGGEMEIFGWLLDRS